MLPPGCPAEDARAPHRRAPLDAAPHRCLAPRRDSRKARPPPRRQRRGPGRGVVGALPGCVRSGGGRRSLGPRKAEPPALRWPVLRRPLPATAGRGTRNSCPGPLNPPTLAPARTRPGHGPPGRRSGPPEGPPGAPATRRVPPPSLRPSCAPPAADPPQSVPGLPLGGSQRMSSAQEILRYRVKLWPPCSPGEPSPCEFQKNLQEAIQRLLIEGRKTVLGW